MRVGVVVLPELPWAQAREQWRRLDEWGFHSAWTYDHLAWRTLADGPWHATVPTLAAAALETTRIRIGTFVASPNFRHPVPFAKELMTLDDLSGGRFTLGVGAGGTGVDATVLGDLELTPRQRVDRFAEFVELLDRLLTAPSTAYAGDWYTADDARMIPGCIQQPRIPFVVAANGPRAMRVTAKHGQGWVTNGVPGLEDENRWWTTLSESCDRLDDALAAEGRVSNDVQRLLSIDSSGALGLASVEHFREVLGRAAERGFDEVVVHWPRADGVYAGEVGVLERVATDVLPTL